ncbi:hypothetical protein M5U04_08020 [Xenorhabdus sp. XENO-1]|nr:hypothetical protein [Xenorhabdus bovienii]MCP9268044.1 hypothetical protein [Xenorhabdus bovienii subsp. africana]
MKSNQKVKILHVYLDWSQLYLAVSYERGAEVLFVYEMTWRYLDYP